MPGEQLLLVRIVLFGTLFFFAYLPAQSQTSNETFLKMLREQASYTPDDLAALAKGEAVVKVLKTTEKNEVGSCGVIRISSVPDLSMALFVASLTPPEDGTVLSKGGFSSPAVIADLQSLKLEKRDVDDLRKCKVGECKLNLPAAMIESLQNEINWSAPDVQNQVTRLFRQMLLDYVRDYSERGNDALIQYDNRKSPIRLADEHNVLLDKALFIRDLAPEFVRYLEKYPGSQLTGAENGLDWAKVTFGLEPIITVTDKAVYTRVSGGSQLLLIATKQIFASRYADSSLAISGLVTVSAGDVSERYLIFTSLSRSASLRGIFGGFARGVAGRETVTRVKTILQRAKMRLESGPVMPVSTEIPAEDTTTLQRILEQSRDPWTIAVFAIVFAGATYFIYRRFAGRSS